MSFYGYDGYNSFYDSALVTIWKQHIGLMASCFCDAIRFILNHNFVQTAEYGKCTDPRDGIGALMINSGFYF